MRFPRLVASIGAVGLTLVLTAGALGQDGLLAGLVQPLVVNIEQHVPVDVTLAVPLEDGSTVTVTTPITVGVALQVKIDGAGVVAVQAGEADAPAVEVEEVVSEESAAGELVDLAGIPYAVDSGSGLTITQIRAKEAFGNTQLVGELRNDGDAATRYVLLTAKFYDADGALLDVGSGATSTQEIEPGGSSSFTILSTVPFADVASYALEMK